MADSALLINPQNREYVEALKQVAGKICRRYGLDEVDIGFDRHLPVRRVVDGKDDGPYILLTMPQGNITMRLVGSGKPKVPKLVLPPGVDIGDGNSSHPD